jgi:hypothetical protein
MNKLQMLIDALPKEVQNIIGTYNVEHRGKMKSVFQEMLTVACDECGDKVNPNKFIWNTVLFINFSYCCNYCCYTHEFDLRKSYLLTHS